ncbi:unnamed protein product [Triticum turgidum subsp. durum]|uniref:Pentatricopeptide repeat-containing protein n=1 Tax=Triticum turgidum subsp. durum TaxID=4567 RepID=A0A9R1AD89_TRITD|nr:unnamed protein product [Triticum turgidum subsp. durum]
MRVPSKNNQLNQSEETDLKDYTQGSLAIVSEIEPKDAIMQLLMQETYSRSECSTLIKIIQERVVDPDSGGIADGEIALLISWKADNQPTLGYSSFSPNVSLPSTSSFQIHGHGFDNSAAADTVPILTPASRSLFNDNKADNIQPAFKRRYSVVRDIPEDLRRVRTKADGNPIHITKFKKVDVVRNCPGEGNKLLSDVPLLGANNLAHSNIVSKVERGNEKLDVPGKPPAVPNKDLKNGFPLKLEPLDGLIPFEQKMMDLSHQKHKDAAKDDSGSVSKLMFMGDIEATPRLLGKQANMIVHFSLQLQNGSKSRRRKQSNSPRTTPRAADSPAMGTRRRLGDATVKAEVNLVEQTTPITMDKQDPDYVPERRPAGRLKKANCFLTRSHAHVFGKAGNYTEALRVIKEMEDAGCKPDAVTYNELAGSYARAGFYQEAAKCLDTMIDKGLLPNTFTYNTIMTAYGNAGKVDEALALFDRMKKNGFVPYTNTYNLVLGMLGKKSRFAAMLETLGEMSRSGCTPNRVTWNTLLAVCGKRGMESYVTRVLEGMKSCRVELCRDTYNTLICAYGRCGSRANAFKMYDEMTAAGFAPCLTTYNALLNVLSRQGDWTAARSIVSKMKSEGFKPNDMSYSLLLQCHAKGGNAAGIEAIEKEVYQGTIFPSWVILRTLVIANFKCRRLEGIERAFQEVKTRGHKPDLVILNSMLSIYAKNGMYSKAMEMFESIEQSGLSPDLITYNSLMDMYAKSNEPWEAEKILKRLRTSQSQQQQQLKPDVVSYNTVINGFCKEGLIKEAQRVLSEMIADGVAPCVITYHTLVGGYASREMFAEAREVVGYMIQRKLRPMELTYKRVVDSYCRAKRYEEARDFLAVVAETDPKSDQKLLGALAARVESAQFGR